MKTNITPYLLWAFLLSWILQIAASFFYLHGHAILYQYLLITVMYMPLVGALLSGSDLGDLGWRPVFKGHIKSLLLAWFGPAVLSILGAVVYFLLFPAALDLTGTTMVMQLGSEASAQLEAAGITIPQYLLISTLSAVTYAPFLNALAALGEEVGWRGVLYPALKQRFGLFRGRVLGGIIWGIWHWPIMLLTGYEYGTDYIGAPVLGLIVFCLFTIGTGIFVDILYVRTHCIWIPSLAHGAINAIAALPIYFTDIAYIKYDVFGPMMIGLLGMIPLWAAAAIMLRKERRTLT